MRRITKGYYELTNKTGTWSLVNIELGGWKLFLNGEFIEWYATKREAMQDMN